MRHFALHAGPGGSADQQDLQLIVDAFQAVLEEVVEHYNKGGTKNSWLSDKIVPLKLTPQESVDLVEFMRACTGPFVNVSSARLPQ